MKCVSVHLLIVTYPKSNSLNVISLQTVTELKSSSDLWNCKPGKGICSGSYKVQTSVGKIFVDVSTQNFGYLQSIFGHFTDLKENFHNIALNK